VKVSRADIHVAAAAGLSVYLPLYWLATTLTDECGNPEPLTASKVGVLLSTLAAYMLAPIVLRPLSRRPLAVRIPSWLSVPVVGSTFLVAAFAALSGLQLPVTLFAAVILWLGLSLWTMPAAAAVYYFGAVVRRVKAWHRGPDYNALSLQK